ncbi:MAG: hypothetical protein WCW30_02640, partial [Candidatus Gracilibacteria bacterium]
LEDMTDVMPGIQESVSQWVAEGKIIVIQKKEIKPEDEERRELLGDLEKMEFKPGDFLYEGPEDPENETDDPGASNTILFEGWAFEASCDKALFPPIEKRPKAPARARKRTGRRESQASLIKKAKQIPPIFE